MEVVTLLILLNKYIFSAIQGEAMWELITHVWRKITQKSWEELYFEAFQSAFEEERPRLSQYASEGEVRLNTEALHKALHRNLQAPVGLMSLGEISEEQFINLLAEAMKEQGVLEIGGHTLREDDITQLSRNVVQKATAIFRDSIIENEDAFRQAVIREAGESRKLIQDVNALLTQHYDITIRKLGTIERKIDQQGEQLDEIRRHVEPAARGELYQEDIRHLAQSTRQTVTLTSKYSRIRVGSEYIPINRPCIDTLKRVVESDSLVVVGEPGVGKSGALHELATHLLNENFDIVFITVDSLAASSLGEISSEFGLSHDLVEVFRNWEGEQPAFFIIDALDAARSGQLARTIRDLIALIFQDSTRWRVIASIRKFDLRYGQEISELFAGSPPTEFQDPEFSDVQHINIPLLTDGELQQISEKSPLLGKLITVAPEDLKNLLRVPLTLNLAGELLTQGIGVDELTPIYTQIELLEKYWQKQVVRSDGEGDAREAILRQITGVMVSEQSLRVSRSRVGDLALTNSGLLADLLSCQILTEWQPPGSQRPERAVLTFEHHVLYDYAIARLLLRGTTNDFVEQISRQKYFVLTIRPSLVLHFQYLWQQDETRHRFWQVALELIRSAEVPAIGKIIAPGIVAQLSAEISDLEPLLTELFSSGTELKETARYGLQQTIIILGTGSADIRYPIIGEGAGLWSELAERLSAELSPETTFLLQQLLFILLEQPHLLTREQINACGIASRRLLSFTWEQPIRNSWLVKRALTAVCRTFHSNIEASTSLIRKVLEQQNLEKYGYEELPELAREILAIIPYAPELVTEIYKTAFQYQETSQEATHRGGQIISFTSNRTQDYEGALYRLTEAFPHFLRSQPDYAVQALVTVLDNYAFSRPYLARNRHLRRKSFIFRSHEAFLERDYSATWDARVYKHDNPVKMLNSFSELIEELAEDTHKGQLLEEIIDFVGQHNYLASLWKRLLIRGASHPQNVGLAIRSLAWATPILFEDDTIYEAVRFISVIYPFLSKGEREQVEQAILSITELMVTERAEPPRNFLLRSIPEELLETEEAKKAVSAFLSSGFAQEIPDSPPNLPNRFGREAREDIRATASEAEIHALDLTEQVKNFIQNTGNNKPDARSVDEVFAALHELGISLQNSTDVSPDIAKPALNKIIEACEVISRTDELDCNSELGAFVREILLSTVSHPSPVYNPEQDDNFNEHISWGVPAPRVSAANGLILISRYQDCLNEAIQGAIKRLSTDSVPAVRFQIARNCNSLYHSSPELMWQLVEQFSQQEQSLGVLQGLLDHAFRQLLSADTVRIIGAAATIFNRVREGSGAGKVQALCAGLVLRAYLLHEHRASYDLIVQIIESPVENYDATQGILLNLRHPLSADFAGSNNPQQNQIRSRALEIFIRCVRSIRQEIEQSNQQEPPQEFSDLSADEQQQVRNLAQLVNTLGTEVYFASGAFAEKEINQGGRVLGTVEKQRFLEDFAPIFDELVQIASVRLFGYGFGSMTHRIIEALESLVPANPSQVFSWLGLFIQAGKHSGYQYESLAATQVVELVQLYLAQYRELIQKEHQDTLIELLDVFVEAGWKEAVQLTYRLDEIFR